MPFESEIWGSLPGGQDVWIYTLRNQSGLSARICSLGARLVALNVPDRYKTAGNVVLGFNGLDDYRRDTAYLGAAVGRVAGRIGNGHFRIGGRTYDVGCNSESFCLHGGANGFSNQLWRCDNVRSQGEDVLELICEDLEEVSCFPGDVRCTLRYRLRDDNTLELRYRAESSMDTPLNLTHHSYFNLAGSADVLSHEVQLACAHVIALGSNGSPERQAVKTGYNDYRTPQRLASRAILESGNADFYGFLDGGRTLQPRFAARVWDPHSGRVMEVFTTEPGIVFYAGLWLEEGDSSLATHNAQVHRRFAGLCLETQDYSDSINYPQLGSAWLEAGKVFESTTEYRFSVD